MMSEVGLQMSSNSIDPYLRQVVPVLQTCKQAVRDITQRDLKIQGKARGVLVVHFIFEVRPDEQQGNRFRSRNPSGTDVKTDVEALVFIEQIKMYTDKLRDVVLKVIIADDEMKKEGSTLSRKIKKLTELKKSLDELARLLDTIVTFYSARFLGFHHTVDLPALEDVKKLKEHLSDLKGHLKRDALSPLFASYDAEFNISNEIIICTILGLSDDYGVFLQELETEMLIHQPIMYYLQKSIESRENELEADGILHQSGKQVLAGNLHRLGFKEKTGKIITQHIPDGFVDLQKPSFWAERYLDYVYHHHPLMSYTPRYLHSQHLVDEWFEIKLPLDSGEIDFDVAKLKGSGAVERSSAEMRDSEFAKLCFSEINAVPVEHGFTEIIGSGVGKLRLNETKKFVVQTHGFYDKTAPVVELQSSCGKTDSIAVMKGSYFKRYSDIVAQGSYDETEAAAAAQLGSIEIDSGIKRLSLTERNSEDVICAVRVINISSDKSQGNVLVEKFLKELKNDVNCLFFHGTTHENAMSVIANGIILTRGSKRQDFSNGDGFYLSDTFENAKAWSQAGRGTHQAVVVYNVKRSLLNEGNGLDLSQNPARWEEVVRCCRNGYRNKKSKKDLGKYAFIQGPPCKNPADSKGDNSLLPYEEAGIQLCIRDDSFAEEFGKLTNVACVIFY